MEYRIEETADETAVVHFSGAITFSENVRFRQALSDLADIDDLKHCTLNLSGVEMIDSSGLGMFQIAKEKADTSNWSLKVEGASGHIASLLKLTKLDDILER
tara:strand:+ start:441 stop:746 length:306 start_codon:yes stop_codon:yes gene_type:complete